MVGDNPSEKAPAEIIFLYLEEIDFTRIDAEALPEIVRRLANATYRLNHLVVSDFGGRSGPERASGMVEQVVGAAFQTFEGVDPHPHHFQKAAMLLRGITQGHPFADGNKRTGFYVAMYYLTQVGYRLPEEFSVEDVVSFCLEVSAGAIRDVDVIARQLAHFWNQTLE